jgi:hypothetical protein
MRFLKSQNMNKYIRQDHTIYYDPNGSVTIQNHVAFTGNSSITVPNGTVAQRPSSPVNGDLRYNNETQELEVLSNSSWRAVRYKEPTSITVQNLGIGDYETTIFGPLTPTSESNYPNSNGITVFGSNYGANILVFVENVFQIFGTNYSLQQNPLGYAAGWYLNFNEAPPVKTITVIYGFDN